MDYFAFLYDYEEEIAEKEAIKQLKRLTKDNLLQTAGECFRIVLAYLDIREKINALGSVIEIITDENKAILDAVKNIESLYEEAERTNFRSYTKATEAFESTLRLLPDKLWIEQRPNPQQLRSAVSIKIRSFLTVQITSGRGGERGLNNV